MNQLLLTPADVLFFRDGRPMEGALSGHGAAWPLPNVVNAALHAAFHRSGLAGEAHHHRRGWGGYRPADAQRVHVFGSVTSVGPFPVKGGRWFFPRPLDAQKAGSSEVTHQPHLGYQGQGSLPKPLRYPVCNSQPPSKDQPQEAWLSGEAFEATLGASATQCGDTHYQRDADLYDAEYQVGIGIDPDTGTTGQGDQEGAIYSASYLRLREGCQLGMLAEAIDKVNRDPNHRRDLVPLLFDGEHHLIVGGQQRVCSVERRTVTSLPLPRGIAVEGTRVKWVLLTPAIWPDILPNPEKGTKGHPGGWLPNWICHETGSVHLLDGPGKEKARRLKLPPGKPIRARLVGAIIPKPVTVTGWSLGDQTLQKDAGAKSTHLAVAAGAVFYFEAETPHDARQLAKALNWHGETDGTAIINRRSTLCGEKGFGIGVCGIW